MINKYGTALSVSLLGINGQIIKVETDIIGGLPKFTIIGLPDISLKEAKYRVSSSFNYCGINIKAANITVNLSPASIYKTGSGFDLAIAMSILNASNIVNNNIKNWIFIAELGLDGRLYPVKGILPMVNVAYKNGYKNIFVATDSKNEAKLVSNMNIISADNIVEVINFFGGNLPVPKYELFDKSYDDNNINQNIKLCDFKNIKGNALGKYALEIAATGGHNVFMFGTAGSGKTMLAKSLPTILPKLSIEDSIEVTSIYSIAGKYKQNELISVPPFCAPHHTASLISLVGGGRNIKPGAISLAHKGVLFLDEACEFSSKTLDSLRQPLEDKMITIDRANATAIYPANFQLILATNPCQCGYYGSKKHVCKCSAYQVNRYISKISGPLLDRIDIQFRVETDLSKVLFTENTEGSEVVLQRVIEARNRIKTKFSDLNISCVSQLESKYLYSNISKIKKDVYSIVEKQINMGKISMRGADKTLRLAITIASLDKTDIVNSDHIMQALALRMSIDK